MYCKVHAICAVTALLLLPSLADARGFLHGRGGVDDKVIREEDFRTAMGEVLGCGNGHERDRFPQIQRALEPIWKSMPKDQNGRVGWKQLRYIAHRYFMQQSSLLVRGFETTKHVTDKNLGHAEILNKHVPALVESTMNNHNSGGYLLEDAVTMVATVEQLIFDAEIKRLHQAYDYLHMNRSASVSEKEMFKLMEVYMIYWMVGEEDDEYLRSLLRKPEVMQEGLPAWTEVIEMVNGMVKGMEFKRQVAPQPGHARVALNQKYDLQDAHDIVGLMATNFASFWEVECRKIKSDLVELDRSGTGRVKLSDFYGSNADGEWRFGESVAYLRDLGALDESKSTAHVIIPNYLQAASNCIVTTEHYLVCCANECEDILGEIESAIDAPTATPAQITSLVRNMTDFDDKSPNLEGGLDTQLNQIAGVHGGKVPLHGRLFAQWLHYVFPRECPFPHKTGTITQQTTHERGDDMLATKDEVAKYAAARGKEELATNEQDVFASQWSEDEELVGDYSLHLRAPWERSHKMAFCFALLMGIFAIYVGATRSTGGKVLGSMTSEADSKVHFV